MIMVHLSVLVVGRGNCKWCMMGLEVWIINCDDGLKPNVLTCKARPSYLCSSADILCSSKAHLPGISGHLAISSEQQIL